MKSSCCNALSMDPDRLVDNGVSALIKADPCVLDNVVDEDDFFVRMFVGWM